MASIRTPTATREKEKEWRKVNGGTHSDTNRDREKREITITIFDKVILCAEGHAMLRLLEAGAEVHGPEAHDPAGVE